MNLSLAVVASVECDDFSLLSRGRSPTWQLDEKKDYHVHFLQEIGFGTVAVLQLLGCSTISHGSSGKGKSRIQRYATSSVRQGCTVKLDFDERSVEIE